MDLLLRWGGAVAGEARERLGRAGVLTALQTRKPQGAHVNQGVRLTPLPAPEHMQSSKSRIVDL